MIPGPTLVMKPGDKVTVKLTNNLKNSMTSSDHHSNTLTSLDNTNIHTHGLHVDPSADSIFKVAAPNGGVVQYEYNIPQDHAPGIHWYHSHIHG